MLLTIGATYIFYQSEETKDLVRFQGEIERCKNRIDSKIKAYVGLLKAGRGFVESNAQLTKESFNAFVNSLEVEENYPEVGKIGFSEKIDLNGRDALIKKIQAEGDTNFEIFPASEKNEFQPVTFIAPATDQNLSTVGFDLLSEPAYQTAIEQSLNSGEPTATDVIQLNREIEEAEKNGFMIFMPVYKDGKTPSTIEDRNRFLEGFIYDSVDVDAFLQDAQNSAGVSDIALTVYENEAKPENIIAQTKPDFQADKKSLAATTEFNVAGKKWIVDYRTLPAFNSQSGINWTPIMFVIGIIFSLSLFGLTYLESYARAKAEKITTELQESEREKGFLLEREQKARQIAEESGRAKDEFISIVSHELRTPLNSIAGWSKILQTESVSEKMKVKALQTIERNVRIQTAIVEDLLDFSQILSSNSRIIKSEVDLSNIFDEVYAEVERLAGEKKIFLFKENNLNKLKIFGDGEKIKKILKNLFSNAVKFTPEGGKIFAELNKNDGKVEIKIKDTGQGIEPKFMPRIFETFQQADSSSTRSHGGLGLGLSVTRRIVELHGGKISAASEGIGKGAVFIVELPA